MARELIVATNPARRRRKMSKAQRAAALRNLRKARAARKGGGGGKVRRRRNPARRSSSRAIVVRRRRSNPARSGGLVPRGFVDRQLIPAAIGGAGAVANDVAYNIVLNMLPPGIAGGLVEQFRSGFMRHVGKVGSALALGYVARMVTSRRTADTMAAGALTVIGYNIVRDGMARFAPTLPLGDMGAYIPPVGLGYAGAGYAPAGVLNERYGSNYNRGTGLAAYIAPRLSGLRGVNTFGVPQQLSQPNFYGPATRAESYSEEYSG